jgi:hypothetical protein
MSSGGIGPGAVGSAGEWRGAGRGSGQQLSWAARWPPTPHEAATWTALRLPRRSFRPALLDQTANVDTSRNTRELPPALIAADRIRDCIDTAFVHPVVNRSEVFDLSQRLDVACPHIRRSGIWIMCTPKSGESQGTGTPHPDAFFQPCPQYGACLSLDEGKLQWIEHPHAQYVAASWRRQ